jgi:hypothetical protein
MLGFSLHLPTNVGSMATFSTLSALFEAALSRPVYSRLGLHCYDLNSCVALANMRSVYGVSHRYYSASQTADHRNRYDSVIYTGRLAWQDRLNSLNLPFFLASTGFFTNYTVRIYSILPPAFYLMPTKVA